MLSGNYTYDTKFDASDWRSRNAAHTGEALKKNVDRAEKLKQIAAQFNITLPQLAVAYTLANPAMTSAIVGVRKPSHIIGVLPAVNVKLDDSALATIRDIALS